jgi:hypothetical protein
VEKQKYTISSQAILRFLLEASRITDNKLNPCETMQAASVVSIYHGNILSCTFPAQTKMLFLNYKKKAK